MNSHMVTVTITPISDDLLDTLQQERSSLQTIIETSISEYIELVFADLSEKMELSLYKEKAEEVVREHLNHLFSAYGHKLYCRHAIIMAGVLSKTGLGIAFYEGAMTLIQKSMLHHICQTYQSKPEIMAEIVHAMTELFMRDHELMMDQVVQANAYFTQQEETEMLPASGIEINEKGFFRLLENLSWASVKGIGNEIEIDEMISRLQALTDVVKGVNDQLLPEMDLVIETPKIKTAS